MSIGCWMATQPGGRGFHPEGGRRPARHAAGMHDGIDTVLDQKTHQARPEERAGRRFRDHQLAGAGSQFVDKPLRLRAVDLQTGAEAWEAAVVDTTFRGPFPP